MAWIKRNLYFVITVVVGLGLTGYCAYLLFSALDQNKADSDKYSSDQASLHALQTKSPFPDQQNIKAAETDAERVRTFLSEFRKPFAGFPEPTKLDDRHFKEYLQNTIAQLGLEATNAGVGLPANCTFGFSQEVNLLNYPSESIVPWMQEMTEMKAILHILYAAKINYLEKIKRPVVVGEDMLGDDYVAVGPTTNTSGVVVPYMVNFRAFSAEIANVLAGIAASSNCLIVKTIHVSPSREPLPQLSDLQPAAPPPVQMVYQPIPQPLNPFMNPNGLGGGGRGDPRSERRRGLMPPPQFAPVAPTPTVPTGPVIVLTETPLFVTIYIDVVKLKAADVPAPAAAPTANPGRRGER
jgi:hypothetical protein